MNLMLLEISATIAAAGLLGLMVGWRMRFASVQETVDKLQMHERLMHAEAMLEKQTEVDELLGQVAVDSAERDELIDLNQSLEAALKRLEQAALRQRGAATEQRLRTYNDNFPAAGGLPNRADWQAELDNETQEQDIPLAAEFDDETQVLNIPLAADSEDENIVVDETVVLVETHYDPDATLTLDGPLRSQFGNL